MGSSSVVRLAAMRWARPKLVFYGAFVLVDGVETAEQVAHDEPRAEAEENSEEDGHKVGREHSLDGRLAGWQAFACGRGLRTELGVFSRFDLVYRCGNAQEHRSEER